MITAMVLAAGESRRFGQSKQLARLAGKPLLEHVLTHVNESKIDGVLVVLGSRADEIRQQIPFGRASVILNPDYELGMSTSIQAGLRALLPETDAAMIVLADQPFVQTQTLDLLIDEYRRSRPRVVIPTCDGSRGNPVIVDKALFAEMMDIRGELGFRAIFGNHADAIVELAVNDRGVINDIDTMDDFLLLQ